jgi:riboflavin transporter FmnP
VVLQQPYFGINLPIFPGFLRLDFADVPAVIGAITTGPLTALLAMLIRHLLDMLVFGVNTMGVGNLANFTTGVALVCAIGFFFHRSKDTAGYIRGALVGTAALIVVAGLMNYFVLLPVFSRILVPMETIIGMSAAINPAINSRLTVVLYAILPFNLLRAAIVCGVGYIFYRAMRPILPRLLTR